MIWVTHASQGLSFLICSLAYELRVLPTCVTCHHHLALLSGPKAIGSLRLGLAFPELRGKVNLYFLLVSHIGCGTVVEFRHLMHTSFFLISVCGGQTEYHFVYDPDGMRDVLPENTLCGIYKHF